MPEAGERPAEISVELLRLLIDRVEDYAIFALTTTGHVASWNAGAQRIKGYRADEIIGQHFSQFYRREEIEAGKCEMELEVAARVGRFEDEGWRLRSDGSMFWANVVITALRDDSGQLVGFAKVTRDLTARRAAEHGSRRRAEAQAAKRAADTLQTVSTALAGALTRAAVVDVVASRVLAAFAADGGSLVTRGSADTLELEWEVGRTRDEIDAARTMTLDHPSLLAEAVRTRQSSFFDDAPAREDDARPPAVARATAVLPLLVRDECIGAFMLTRSMGPSFSGPDQALVRTIATQCALALDRASIFERELEAKRHADFLARASSLLSSSLEVGVVAQRLAELAVPTLGDWCVIAGVDGDDLRPMASIRVDRVGEQVSGDLRLLCTESPIIREVMRSGTARRYPVLQDADLREICGDDEQLDVMRRLGLRSALVVPLLVGTRTIAVMALAWAQTGRRYRETDVAVVQDVCGRASLAMENARLYSELQHAVRARDDFMSVAVHELRTPLAAMQLTLQALDRLMAKRAGTEDYDPVPRERLAKAILNGERLGRLIAELLDVARLRSNRLQLDRETLDLGALVQTAVGGIGELATRSSSELRLELESSIVGSFDRFRLEQVVTNLVTNALKYGQGKPIRVELRREADVAVLAVHDQGIGIDPCHQRRIFERFERAVTDRNFGGLGLGLWISRQIVEASGGTIEVDSRPGEGSHFMVRLPLALENRA